MVVAATLAFGALAAVWSVVAPLGEAPDEPAHLALVLHLADGHPYPSYDGLENQGAIIRLCKTYASATRACPREGEPVTPTSMRRHAIGEAPNKAARPAWDDEGGSRSVGQLNQMPQHPPLYYQAMAQVLRAERAVFGGPWSADRELALLRLVNALLVMPLPLLAWWAARRFGLPDGTGLTAALLLFAVPMLTHIGSTLNNDNLLTLLAGVLAALLAGVVRGDRSTRTAVGVGVVTGLALLTKAFAFVFPPLIVVAYLIGTTSTARSGSSNATTDFVPEADGNDGEGYEVRVGDGGRAGPGEVEGLSEGLGWRARLGLVVRPVAVAAALVAVLAGWWYVGVRARTGRFAPTVENARLTADLAPDGFSPSVVAFGREFSRSLDNRFWGSFGWYTIRFPTLLATLCTVLLVLALARALAPKVGAAGSTRLQRASLLLPFAALGAFVAQHAWSLYATTSKFQFIQGRYLFGGVVGLMVLAAIGVEHAARRWSPLVAVGAAALLQAEALRRAVQGWWGGPGLGPRGQAKAMVAWSGWPGEALLALGVLAAGAALWLAWELVVWLARSEVDEGLPVGSTAS